MIAYEFPFAILVITIAWNLLQKGVTEVFSFSTIASTPVWNQVAGPLGFIGFAILLVVLLLVTPAELSKIPFDSAEAETELAGGLLVEYSGRNLAMFYLTDGVKTVVMASIIVALFFPYNLSALLGLGAYEGMIIDVVFFLFKVFLVVLFSVTLIRVAIARLKIDQIVYTYWIPLTLASLVGLILVMWDSVIMNFFTTA
jgi:formate hydrogenlyase subunit 4